MNLSSTEAIEAMKAGKKVAHDLFCAGEFATSDPNGLVITLEDGVRQLATEFWNMRAADYWQKDWFIVD